MPKTKGAMGARQCEIAAESYAACVLSQSGYDIFVQYGARQQHYNLLAVKGERTLRISVKGSQVDSWMLAIRYLKGKASYHDAIDQWLAAQPEDVIFMFVGFLGVSLPAAPRVYVARSVEIAAQLKLQSLGEGRAFLREDMPTHHPRSKSLDKVPASWRYSMERIDTF